LEHGVEVDRRNLDRVQTGIPIPSVKYSKGYGSQGTAGGSFSYWDKDKKQGLSHGYHQQGQAYPSRQAVPPQSSATGLSSLEQQYTEMMKRHNTRRQQMTLDMMKDRYRQMKKMESELTRKDIPYFDERQALETLREPMRMLEEEIRMQEEASRIQRGIDRHPKNMIVRRYSEHPMSAGSRKLQNRPPVAKIYVDRTSGVVAPGKTLHVNLSARNSYDPDGDKLSYQWYISGRPWTKSRDFSFDFGKGYHDILLKVSDGILEASVGTKIVVKETAKTTTRSPPSLPRSKDHFPDGMLVRAKGQDEVYVMENSRKRHIPDPETFNAKGYDWSKVIEVDKKTLDRIPTGSSVPSVKTSGIAKPEQAATKVNQAVATSKKSAKSLYRAKVSSLPLNEGDLIKTKDRPETYLIRGKRRYHIPDPETFSILGYRCGQEKIISLQQMNSLSYGGKLPSLRNSMLIQAKGRNEVYLIENNQKRHILSPEAFNALGFKWNNIVKVDKWIVDRISQGRELR
jgi:hypothetical protein